jgi:hypothetical protein
MSSEFEVLATGQGLEGRETELERYRDATDLASDQDQIVYLLHNGERVAAIVPRDVAEEHERQIAEVLSTPVVPFKCPVDFPHEGHHLGPGRDCAGAEGWMDVPACQYTGHAQHELAEIIYRPTPDVHAHWVGDRMKGHQMFMAAMKGQSARRQEELEAAARLGLSSRSGR